MWGDYGHYCGRDRDPFGKSKRPLPIPVDAIDACCRDHDWVYFKHKCTYKQDPRPKCAHADRALCVCAQRAQDAGCNSSPTPQICREKARNISLAFCGPRLGPPPRACADPGSIAPAGDSV